MSHMTGTIQDIRTAFRTMTKARGFTAIAILTLALGIGANSAIFSVVNAVILRPLPFRDAGRLVSIYEVFPGYDRYPFTVPDYLDYRERNRTLDQLAAYANWNANLTGEAEAERVIGVRISGNFFQMAGVDAELGRVLIPDDDTPGRPKVVVIAHGLWQRRFGGDPNAIGRKITLNGDPYTVAGVLRPEFVLPNFGVEVFVPLAADSDPWRNLRSSINFLRVIGKLKPGVTPQQAKADFETIAQQLRREFPQYNENKTAFNVFPLREEVVGNVRLMLLAVLGAVGLVLLIACANMASFLLAKASARRKEMAIRAALGGTRRRLLRQLLTESMMLALSGGALGALFAAWGVKGLLTLLPRNLPRSAEIQVDARMFWLTFLISLVCGVVFGFLPAMEASKTDLNDALRSDGRGATGGASRGRMRRILVIAEVALCLMLLAGAGLLFKSFLTLQSMNPGFDSQRVLAVRLSLPLKKYSNREAVSTLYDRLRPAFENLPGVESVGSVSILPLSGALASANFRIAGRPTPTRAELPDAQYRMVDWTYFPTMHIPITRGRNLSERDTARTQAVAVINEAAAKRYWPNGNPIGEHIFVDDNPTAWRELEIVGVSGDVRLYELTDAPPTCLYVAMRQIPDVNARWIANNMFWVLRSGSTPAALAGTARKAVQNVDPDVAASSIQPLEQYLSTELASRRFALSLMIVFAGSALLLAASGLYALISHFVMQRKREIGIRAALGAQPRDIFLQVVGEGLVLTVSGVVLGLMGTFASARLISTLLFGVTSHDATTILVVAFLLIATGSAASYFPARRAVAIDPVIALRED